MKFLFGHFFAPGTARRIVSLALSGVLLASCAPSLVPSAAPYAAVSVDGNLPADSSYIAMITPYRQKLDLQMNQVIGQSAYELASIRQAHESALGNFVADLMRIQGEKIYGQPIDIALVNNGGLRASIRAGAVTMGNIYELMPFENELLIVKLNGAQMQELFKYIAGFRKTAFSGMTLQYTDNALSAATVGGAPFDPQKSYTAAVYDYIANGGDNMEFMKEVTKEPTGVTLRDLIIRHVQELTKQGQPIEAKVENRLIFK